MTALMTVLDRLGSPALLVLGDVMLDRFTAGAARRVSPEGPVLVLDTEESRPGPGAAAAVAAMLRGLDGPVRLAGVVGPDLAGCELCRLLEEAGIEAGAVIAEAGRPTTTKARFLARAAGRPGHPLLRVDREARRPLDPVTEDRLLDAVFRRLGDVRAVLVSDYAKGVCTPRVLAKVLAAARDRGVPLFVDPARIPDHARYRGAGLLAPNRAEAQLATGRPIETAAEALEAGRLLGESLAVPCHPLA